ncbi:unnamed protein product [Schistosoma margrebowiei]|uniref:Uncharacterized protein n=1 Tax=Schistosoma margrebowiei TaxID=48269 RepID=A0A183M2X7_9TREM|nr:unnamed protein product [Schistosoma margrebowiei]
MKTPTSEGKYTIQWTACMKLDNSDFTDDLSLSHTHEQMQIKTTSVATATAPVDPNIHKGKTKILKYNTENTIRIILDGLTLEEVKTSRYLGSIIYEQGGSHADVKTGTDKTRTAYLKSWVIWNSKQLSANIKFRIFNTNTTTVRLYGAET